jgi:hypothetical protein
VAHSAVNNGPSGAVEGPAALPSRSPLEGAAFVLTQPAPDTIVDVGQQGPLQADALHGATATDRLGLLKLLDRRSAGSDRKEELGVLAPARRVLMPAHVQPPTVRSDPPAKSWVREVLVMVDLAQREDLECRATKVLRETAA